MLDERIDEPIIDLDDQISQDIFIELAGSIEIGLLQTVYAEVGKPIGTLAVPFDGIS